MKKQEVNADEQAIEQWTVEVKIQQTNGTNEIHE